jgi:hypothetical protein
VVAALGVAIPVLNTRKIKIEEITQLVTETAKDISMALGFTEVTTESGQLSGNFSSP